MSPSELSAREALFKRMTTPASVRRMLIDSHRKAVLREAAPEDVRVQKAWVRHWLWKGIASAEQVGAVQDLHVPELFGGLPTGICAECGKPYPCPTKLAVARKPDGPCDCAEDCPHNAETGEA